MPLRVQTLKGRWSGFWHPLNPTKPLCYFTANKSSFSHCRPAAHWIIPHGCGRGCSRRRMRVKCLINGATEELRRKSSAVKKQYWNVCFGRESRVSPAASQKGFYDLFYKSLFQNRNFHKEWKKEQYVSSGWNNAKIRRMFLNWSSKLADSLQSNSSLPKGLQGEKIKKGLHRRWIKEIVDSSVCVYDL